MPERRKIIVPVLAAGGVLVAATVAGVAVVNAAASSADEPAKRLVVTTAGQSSPVPTSTGVRLPPTPVATGTAPATDISRAAAARLVRTAAGGGTVGTVARTTKDGRSAWAVPVTRADGSILTGYVDAASGTVFAWRVDRRPTPTPSSPGPTTGSSDDHSAGHSSGHAGDGDHDGDDD